MFYVLFSTFFFFFFYFFCVLCSLFRFLFCTFRVLPSLFWLLRRFCVLLRSVTTVCFLLCVLHRVMWCAFSYVCYAFCAVKKKILRFFPSLNIRSIQTYTKPAHSTTTEGTVIFPTKNVLPNLMFFFSCFINTGV